MKLHATEYNGDILMKKQILFVDGYNMIGAWPQLVQLKNLDKIQEARDLLLFELANYRKYRGIDELLVVFDAYFVPGLTQSFEEYEVKVVFTKEGETADSFIEREVPNFVNSLSSVRVATSDAAEQWVIFQKGALRMSAQELLIDLNLAKKQISLDAKSYYHQVCSRRNPWQLEQLELLELLRQEIENKPKES